MIAIPKIDSAHLEHKNMSIDRMVLCILVFQNLFNAFSPYLTLVINIIIMLISLLVRHRLRYATSVAVLVACIYLVLLWLLLVTIYRGDAETEIVLKYFRVTVQVSLFALIFTSYRFTASAVVKAINFSLGFHVILVMLQIAFPDITKKTAPIFGFGGEITILEEYALRKLGASSSYDTASLLSIAALLFFYLQFTKGKRTPYLIMTAVAFVATLMSSRLGIAMSLLIVTVLTLNTILRARLIWKLFAILWFAGLMVSAYYWIYPLLLHTLGISDVNYDQVNSFVAISDYGTTGTLEALTGDHLKPLDQDLSDLFFGFVVDPNTIGKYTDIGYVKLVYHVGIVGTLIIFLAHLYMLIVVLRIKRTSVQDIDRSLVARFFIMLILISVIFNYKSLELHSRGAGDFIYMLFLFMVSSSVIGGGMINTKKVKIYEA